MHSLNSLKYAMHLRYYSPKVELHRQFSRLPFVVDPVLKNRLHRCPFFSPTCAFFNSNKITISSPCFAEVEDAATLFTDVSELDAYLSSISTCPNPLSTGEDAPDQRQPAIELFDFDHVYVSDGFV